MLKWRAAGREMVEGGIGRGIGGGSVVGGLLGACAGREASCVMVLGGQLALISMRRPC